MVRKTFIFLLIVFISSSAKSQWRLISIARFGLESVYFLDLPGPPRIGFTGGYNQLLKTSNGGNTWKTIYGLDSTKTNLVDSTMGVIKDFVFKDSLVGWFASEGDLASCYKTTDGGENWFPLFGTVDTNSYGEAVTRDGEGIYYDNKTDGLFVSTYAGPGILVSWDEGATWTDGATTSTLGGFAFASDDSGMLSGPAGTNGYSNGYWYRTTDGGVSWNPFFVDSTAWQPLAIKGTQTYFAFTTGLSFYENQGIWGTVLRTDDFGNTWEPLYTFPWDSAKQGPQIGEFDAGCIYGDLKNLFVDLPTGCYHSNDEGITWNGLCGVPSIARGSRRFYVKYPYVFLTAVVDSVAGIGQLWLLNLDSLNLIHANFSEQCTSGAKQESLHPGDTAYVQFRSTDTLGANVAVDSVFLWVSYDTGSIAPVTFSPPSGWEISALSNSSGHSYAELIDTSGIPLDSSRNLLTVSYQTWLSENLSTKIYLDSIHTFGHRLNCDCAVSSILSADTISHSSHAALDSVEINLTGCGDSLILAAMEGQPPFSIMSIIPNPASSTITVEHFAGPLTIMDPLGRGRDVRQTGNTLDISSLPSGVYFLSDGYSRAKFVKN